MTDTRKQYTVIVDGKATFTFHAEEGQMIEGMIYKAGDTGAEYLCKGNEFIKQVNKQDDTYRDTTEV